MTSRILAPAVLVFFYACTLLTGVAVAQVAPALCSDPVFDRDADLDVDNDDYVAFMACFAGIGTAPPAIPESCLCYDVNRNGWIDFEDFVGIEFHHPKRSSAPLERVLKALREVSPRYEEDRGLSADIVQVAKLIASGRYCEHAASVLPAQNA